MSNSNETELQAEIDKVREKEFGAWFGTKEMREMLANTTHPNQQTRESAWRELAETYNREGRTQIDQSFTKVIGLREQIANLHGQIASRYYFHHDDAIADGIKHITENAPSVLEDYLELKAGQLHKYRLAPPDLFMPIGNWGKEKLEWDEVKDIIKQSFAKIGMAKKAAAMTEGKGGAGQPFWDSFTERLEYFGGLMQPRIGAHEMGHAIHFSTAGEGFNKPDLAELIALFSEELFRREMDKRAENTDQKIALLSNQLDTDVVMLGFSENLLFEHSAYKYAEEHPDDRIPFDKLWREAGDTMLGHSFADSKEVDDMRAARLMAWDHYIHQPAYGSSYLLAWAAAPKLLQQMDANPEAFKETFQEKLKKGKSLSAEEFLHAFNIDINQPDLWTDRLQKMSDDLAELKDLHKNQMLDTFVSPKTFGGRIPPPQG